MKFPDVIVFDVDGVLVDVRGSFQKTTLETVEFFTGKKVNRAQLHDWKNKSGYNDDWKLSTAWIHSLGGEAQYDEVKAKFVDLYWGKDGDGNVKNEKWVLSRKAMERLAQWSELAVFTGRTKWELEYTLQRCDCRALLSQIVTVEDVKLPKPDAEGLIKIANGRDARHILYIGDNVDDALAARSAKMPFAGVLPSAGEERTRRAKRLQELGALIIFSDINELEPWLLSGSRRHCQNTTGTAPGWWD
ncbi:MAG TPA: HAD-IA family hydrolase [Candidatus Acidoferrum sp.]|nr:HAD-IA family hydrolase [Candidatus Acidoferrum sp.]